MADVVSNTYATSLFELSLEENISTELLEQLTEMSAILEQSPEYVRLVSAPNITAAEKGKLIETVFGGKINPYLLNFLKLLSDKKRFSYILPIIREYKNLYNNHNGIEVVKIVTAIELTSETEDRLIAKLSSVFGKKVLLEKSVDPGVIGGISVTAGNKQMDATIKSRLEKIKRNLLSVVA